MSDYKHPSKAEQKPVKAARSGMSMENLQEFADAENNTGLSSGKQEQYFTPIEVANHYQSKLPSNRPITILDPQVGDGALVHCGDQWNVVRYGVEMDNRIETVRRVNLITGNCQKVFEIIDDLWPNLRFVCINANPPFGRRWKLPNGDWIDSTKATWDFVVNHGNYGYFIAGAATIEKLGINTHPWVFLYETKPANTMWKNMREENIIGIVCWKRPGQPTFTPPAEVYSMWLKVRAMVDEEKTKRPDFNIWLENGVLKTYLSQRGTLKLKLSKEQVAKLLKINDCAPLVLTTEKTSRVLLKGLVDAGIYQIQPEAEAAIRNALAEVNSLACPIMPVSDFETVAYADEEDALVCLQDINIDGVRLTGGASYALDTGTYQFTDSFKRNKVHYDEQNKQTYTREHECTLSGADRYIQIKDDTGRAIRFMDKPNKDRASFEKCETLLWQWFKKPTVLTSAETKVALYDQNKAVMDALEMMAGYTYYPGQLDYLARVAAKDSGLVAGETGTGKTLMAITLLALKSPYRALIIAPQGTMRSTEAQDGDDENDEQEFQASQWIKEMNRFAPYLQVWELFSYQDYERICSLNNGVLPPGVYVSYYQAMFSNGARERVPDTWNDEKLNEWCAANGFGKAGDLDKDDPRKWCDSVGREEDGIRCIIEPCLSTKVGHQFDMVLLDEAHVATNLGANLTQMLIRLQPKFRWALSATPIPNVVSNLFSLMGWLAVPEWYRGGRRNAAWPYARHDLAKFTDTFMSQERDVTQEQENRRKDPKWRGTCVKSSPIISSPARLLKLLKPTMAFISKLDCRADYIAPAIIDVRVPMGKEQMKLYGHFLNRANITGHPLIRARKQVSYLRNICADPQGFRHGGPKVSSNMNPKVIAILELVRDMIGRKEQVVIINSRCGLTETLQHKLVDAGISIARIDSSITADQHAYQAGLFKSGKAKVMLMGIKCASSYSFDDCNNLIIGSLEYSYGPFNQAIGRIDRVTNKTKKNIYCILHRNSIEEVQFDVVATKGDAATICLRGKRVPRDFKPVDGSEVLAKAIDRFDMTGATPEINCEQSWPKLRDAIRSLA